MSVLDVVADHGRCKNLAYKLVSFPWALLLCGFSWKMKSFESDCTPLVTQLRTFEPMQTIRHKRVSTFPICNILAFFHKFA